MPSHLKLFLFVLSLLLANCKGNHVGITGKWKHETDQNSPQGSVVGQFGWGYLTLNPDSTFVVGVGDETSETIVNDTIPGWHIPNKMMGKWRLDANNLLLHVDDMTMPVYVSFQIIELTEKRLALASAFDKGDTTKQIVFVRD